MTISLLVLVVLVVGRGRHVGRRRRRENLPSRRPRRLELVELVVVGHHLRAVGRGVVVPCCMVVVVMVPGVVMMVLLLRVRDGRGCRHRSGVG